MTDYADVRAHLDRAEAKLKPFAASTPEAQEELDNIAWLHQAERLGIPFQLAQARFSTGLQTPAMQLALEYVIGSDCSMGKCLVLLGPTGVGKSYAAVAALRAGQSPKRFFYFPELSARLLQSPHFDMMRRATTGFAVFDDLGTEYLKDGGLLASLLDEVFYRREGDRLPTIITSNLTVEQFRERMSDRILDRLRGEWGRVVQVPGESLRTGA